MGCIRGPRAHMEDEGRAGGKVAGGRAKGGDGEEADK